MIKCGSHKLIEYKIIKLDTNTHLIIYENNKIEVIGKHITLPIRINKSNKKYVMENNKVYFIDKYLDPDIKYKFELYEDIK
jgi:ribose 5-phosphate isomerase